MNRVKLIAAFLVSWELIGSKVTDYSAQVPVCEIVNQQQSIVVKDKEKLKEVLDGLKADPRVRNVQSWKMEEVK